MQLSDGERLILWMLCELHKHHGINDGEDAEFISQAIYGGHLWALKWHYTGVLGATPDDEGAVDEVCSILDMWSFIEWGFGKLSFNDKARVTKEIGGDRWKFPGFDGNNEGEHLGIASFLVKQMGRFDTFKDRHLNSHHPVLDRYRHMVKAFEAKRPDLATRSLSADEIIELVTAGDGR